MVFLTWSHARPDANIANVDTKTTLPVSEARTKIFKIVDQIQKTGSYYTITEKGKPKAVIMSAEEFESWQETLKVQKMFPNLEKDIQKVNQDVKTGAYKKYSTLEELLEEQGFLLADKTDNKYVSNKNRAQSKKRVKKDKE